MHIATIGGLHRYSQQHYLHRRSKRNIDAGKSRLRTIETAQFKMAMFLRSIVSKNVTALWKKQYYPTFHRDTTCKEAPKTTDSTIDGPQIEQQPLNVPIHPTPGHYNNNNNKSNMSTSLSAAAMAGNNSNGVNHGRKEHGTLVHLLMKTMTHPSAPFEAQQATRNIMNLIKYHDSKAVFLNHNDESVSSTEDMGTTANEFGQFATYKSVKVSNGRIQHRIFFTVRLSKPFWQIKNDECIETLKQNRIFLEQKAFRSTDYIELGWLSRVHPSINWPEELKEKYRQILAMILKCDPPPFDLVKRPKKFGNKERIESLAIVVETAKEDATTITDAMIHKQFREATGALFIPANLIKTFGQQSYRMVLKDHTIFCNGTQTIPIFGLQPELLHMQDDNGNFPISDAIVDVAKHIDIHRTSQSFETGKFLISYPRGQYDYAMQRINNAIDIIIERDISITHPQYLFDGRMPCIGHAPVQFEDKNLNEYATDLCKSFNIDTTQTQTMNEPEQPIIITLNRGRQYKGNNESPSYQSMLTGENMSQNSVLTTPTQQTHIDKLETDVSNLHKQMTDFIKEQKRTAKQLDTKIEKRLDDIHTQNQEKITATFNTWSIDLATKLSEACNTAVNNAMQKLHQEQEGRKRKSTSVEAPSPSSDTMETETAVLGATE